MGSALSAENNVSYIVSSGSVVIDISVDAFDCFFFLASKRNKTGPHRVK